jgi:hypothetical protein
MPEHFHLIAGILCISIVAGAGLFLGVMGAFAIASIVTNIASAIWGFVFPASKKPKKIEIPGRVHVPGALTGTGIGSSIANNQSREWITDIVRTSDVDRGAYQASRFRADPEKGASPFQFRGHYWRYRFTSFDDDGEFDLIERPAKQGRELIPD